MKNTSTFKVNMVFRFLLTFVVVATYFSCKSMECGCPMADNAQGKHPLPASFESLMNHTSFPDNKKDSPKDEAGQ